jgi:hypothetical protein
MTLANFNSNFNFQLRALQQAAECCGIVPDLPPAPPPPVVDCYWFGKLHDGTCSQFSTFTANWTLNGVEVFSGWNTLMVAPPYGTVGNAIQYTDNLSGCSNIPNDYYFWTVVPSTTLTLPSLIGNDGNGDPITVDMFGPICDRKCYEGVVSLGKAGSPIVNGINTAEVNATDYSIFVDLLDPNVDINFAVALGQYYPSPPMTVTVTSGPLLGDRTIRIDGLYSTSATITVYMDDGNTGTLNLVPCL